MLLSNKKDYICPQTKNVEEHCLFCITDKLDDLSDLLITNDNPEAVKQKNNIAALANKVYQLTYKKYDEQIGLKLEETF